MHILKTINLEKRYGKGNNEVIALKPTNLVIEEGEFVAVVGPSGSGKSTLLHLLAGFDNPTKGSVIIDGKDITEMSERELSVFRRRKIGFVFQFYNLIPVLNARENVELPLILDRRKIDKSYIDELFMLLGIADRMDHMPSELSGGQQQRVSIARALAAKPSIIFADEPTGNLDSKNSEEVMDLLRLTLKKYHQTMVMVTHDLGIAETADRIIRIEDGAICQDIKSKQKSFF
ncbi:ABC transporter ATP-binding protein [Kosmotoga olearia]|uniref:ABC transporter related n=1 Tax=Kosmotoga olearia (strain ATCC BAA-1733 / DSM 21960 / TBF 19.5.1) TaxID=521045 RepID=C5CGA5_KOSOT|nr:ABC transporter ATP-binding protein [Kosmotoga olearia]ACR79546.1 ABC transporter related [Kosmotoga olearia TBF 19.5.1]